MKFIKLFTVGFMFICNLSYGSGVTIPGVVSNASDIARDMGYHKGQPCTLKYTKLSEKKIHGTLIINGNGFNIPKVFTATLEEFYSPNVFFSTYGENSSGLKGGFSFIIDEGTGYVKAVIDIFTEQRRGNYFAKFTISCTRLHYSQ